MNYFSILIPCKQFKIKTIRDLVSMKESDRRLLFSFLEDSNYEELVAVLGSFPHITMEIKPHGMCKIIFFILPFGSLLCPLYDLSGIVYPILLYAKQKGTSRVTKPFGSQCGNAVCVALLTLTIMEKSYLLLNVHV